MCIEPVMSSNHLEVFMVAQTIMNLSAMQENWVWALGQEDPWRREWQPTPAFLPGEPLGERSLEGYNPWGRKESDTTEWLTHTHMNSPSLPCVLLMQFPYLQQVVTLIGVLFILLETFNKQTSQPFTTASLLSIYILFLEVGWNYLYLEPQWEWVGGVS